MKQLLLGIAAAMFAVVQAPAVAGDNEYGETAKRLFASCHSDCTGQALADATPAPAGYVGDFFHSEMAISEPPRPR